LELSPLNEDISTTHNSGYSSETDRIEKSDSSILRSSNKKKSLPQKQEYIVKTIVVNGIELNDYMASSNMNECVSALLRKEKFNPKNIKKVIKFNSSGKEKEKRRRLRKNKD
jgi:hypothetical protein